MSSFGPPSTKDRLRNWNKSATKMVRYMGCNVGGDAEGTVLNLEKAGSGVMWYVGIFAICNYLLTDCTEERPKLLLALNRGGTRRSAHELKQGNSDQLKEKNPYFEGSQMLEHTTQRSCRVSILEIFRI